MCGLPPHRHFERASAAAAGGWDRPPGVCDLQDALGSRSRLPSSPIAVSGHAPGPPFLSGRPLTRRALEWARELHGGQLRTVDHAPFILHPLEVAALLSGRNVDDEVVAAGLLHDAVEDTDVGVEEIRDYMGDRVADIVATLTEDSTIAGFPERKAQLRSVVAAAGDDEHAVYAADKVVKARELRAQATRAERSLADPDLRDRLDHYRESLSMLQSVAPELPLVRQLAFELWALQVLPPNIERDTP